VPWIVRNVGSKRGGVSIYYLAHSDSSYVPDEAVDATFHPWILKTYISIGSDALFPVCSS
jgi:hypothetical protein